MTTNKPEVVAWYFPSSKTTLPVVSLNARSGNGQPLIRLSDYEALQAELERERQRRFDGNEQSSREHREEIAVLVEALEQCITSMLDSGYRANSVVIRAARAAIAAHRKQGGEA